MPRLAAVTDLFMTDEEIAALLVNPMLEGGMSDGYGGIGGVAGWPEY